MFCTPWVWGLLPAVLGCDRVVQGPLQACRTAARAAGPGDCMLLAQGERESEERPQDHDCLSTELQPERVRSLDQPEP